MSEQRRKTRKRFTGVRRKVIDRIRRLYARDEPLNITAVKRNHPELMKAAYEVKPFWGWKQALEDAGIGYSNIRIELRDYVTCQLCGRERRALSRHLSRVHEVTSDEYRMDYPDAELVCETLRAALRTWSRWGKQAKRRAFPDWEPLWTKEYALDRLNEFLKRGLRINSDAIVRSEVVLYVAIRNYWENINDAYEALGKNPEDIRLLARINEVDRQEALKRYPDRESLIRAIRKRHRNKLSLKMNALLSGPVADRYLYYYGTKGFGSWREAVEAAGLNYDKIAVRHRKYPTRASVLNAIRERKRKKLPLTVDPMCERKRGRDKTLYSSALKYFGNWKAAIEAAGLDYDKIIVCRRKYPTPASVLNAIRERKRKQLPLNTMSVIKTSPNSDYSLRGYALKYFGGWRAAIEAAGLDYDKILLRPKYPTPASVLNAIRERKRKKLPLNLHAVARPPNADSPLYYSAVKYFRGWRAAIKAAGLDYDKIIVCRRKYPTPTSVLHAIRERKRKQLPLNTTAMTQTGLRRDVTLYRYAAKCFGGWRAAVEDAGLDYEKIKLCRLKYPTPASVLNAIRERKRKQFSLKRTDMDKAGSNSDCTLGKYAMKYFGCWRAAIEAAGLHYEIIVRYRKYPTPASVLKAIRKRKRKQLPLNTTAMAKTGPNRDVALYKYAVKCFGNWRAAIETAGLDYDKIIAYPLKYPTPASVLKAIRERKRKKLCLTVGALCEGKWGRDGTLHTSALRHFGGWPAAIKAAGLNYDKIVVCRLKYPTPASVLKAIRERKRKKFSLNTRVMTKTVPNKDKSLLNYAVKYFGRWQAAIEAAGLDYDKLLFRRLKYPTPASVLKAIRERKRKKLRLTVGALCEGKRGRDGTLHTTALRHFGGWPAAIRAAGLNYDKIVVRRLKYLTAASVLDAIRERKRKKFSLNTTVMTKTGPNKDKSLLNYAVKHFGSWRAAIEAAGLDYDKLLFRRLKYPTPESVVKAIRERKRGKLPLNSDSVARSPNADYALQSSAVKYFGCWRAAIEAAGLDYDKVTSRSPYVTPEFVLKEIRRRKSNGVPVNLTAVNAGRHKDAHLLTRALALFGTWRQAVEKAGFSYDKIKLNVPKYPTRESVLKAIRERKKKKFSLSTTVMTKTGPNRDVPLYRYAAKYFGRWKAAIEAAGLDYDKIRADKKKS